MQALKLAIFVCMIGVLEAVLVLAFLSKKIGEAQGLPPYYRWFYLTAAFLGVWLLVPVYLAPAALIPKPMGPWALVSVCLYSVSASINLIVAWRYWGWLPTALRARPGGPK